MDSRVTFFSPSTWSDVAQWWAKLYEPKVSTSREITDRVADLTKGLLGREEKTKSLYDFVKGLRYVSILLNEGTFVPHPAEETLKNRYGDCKDKAVLLVAMLRSIGINASVALVDTSGLIDKEMPSPLHFDHAVVAMRNPDGTYSFLDPTNSLTPYGFIPDWIQYRHALIPDGKGGEIVLIPACVPDQNRVEELIDANVQDFQTVTVTNRSTTYSSNVLYHMIPTIPQPQLIQMLKELMVKQYKDFDILSVKEEPADSNGLLRSETTLAIRDFTRKMGQIYTFNPLFDADRLHQESIIGTSSRTTDIELDGPKRLVCTSTVKLPASLSFEFMPKPVEIKNEKYGTYRYELTQSGGLLRIRREVNIVAKRVAAKDYPEFREFYKACLMQDDELVGIKAK